MSHAALPGRAGQVARGVICITVTGVLSVACAYLPADHDSGEIANKSREFSMNQRWQKQPLSQLVAVRGKPRLLLDIPGGGTPPGFVAVYGHDPETGCLDTFALVYGVDPEIRAYYCR